MLMSRLRCTDNSKCPFRCQVASDRCGNSFSTTHYLLECPGTPRLRSQIQELLSEDDFDLEPNEQVAIALQAASQDQHPLVKAIMETPMKCSCELNHAIFINYGRMLIF